MVSRRDRSIFELATVAVRRWRLLVLVPLLCAGVAGAVYLWMGPDYVATSRFVPQNPKAAGAQLTGLAERFGLSLGGGGGETSPEFYVQLLDSPELLQRLVDTRFTFTTADGAGADTLSGTLAELYEIEGDTPLQVRRGVIRRLLEDVTAEVAPETGIVTAQVESPWRGLAVAINARLLELVNEFNVNQRRSLASEEREFVAQRREEARQELLAAEAALQEFVSHNRRFSPTSELMVEQARLQRQVDVKQQVYLTLAQAFEQARIDEVRSTPVITVVESPETYPRRAPGSLPLVAILAAFVGLVAAIGYVIVADLLRVQKAEHPEAYEELKAHVRDAKSGLGLRAVGRRERPGRAARRSGGQDQASERERFAFADAESGPGESIGGGK